VAPAVDLDGLAVNSLYKRAFAQAAGAGAGQAAADGIVWVRGEDELLVEPAGARLVLRPGFVLACIPAFCVETGEVEIVVPFAVGRPDAPLGLVMATEPVPRGPAAVVERWGDHFVAAAWAALVRLGAGVAAAAGIDDKSQVLLPAALVASTDCLTVLPQAQHIFDTVKT
jgi:hypothetical protein